MRASSSLLVALQFALLGLLALGTSPAAVARGWVLALPLFAAGLVLGIWALGYNRIGNFNIRPDVKAGAELITRGPYRRIRHPMYTALLLAALGLVAIDPRPWRVLAFLALLGVLILKARREEALLSQRFAQYPEYMKRAARFLPGLY